MKTKGRTEMVMSEETAALERVREVYAALSGRAGSYVVNVALLLTLVALYGRPWHVPTPGVFEPFGAPTEWSADGATSPTMAINPGYYTGFESAPDQPASPTDSASDDPWARAGFKSSQPTPAPASNSGGYDLDALDAPVDETAADLKPDAASDDPWARAGFRPSTPSNSDPTPAPEGDEQP